jgi:hypothetical protein
MSSSHPFLLSVAMLFKKCKYEDEKRGFETEWEE